MQSLVCSSVLGVMPGPGRKVNVKLKEEDTQISKVESDGL